MKKKLALGLVAALMMGTIIGCSKPAAVEGNFTDGVNEGSAEGYGGKLTVSVEVKDGNITSIDLVDHSETAGIGDDGADKTFTAIMDAQSTDVETVSGATITSKAVIEAVEIALGLKEAPAADKEPEKIEAQTFVDGIYEGEAKGYGGDLKVKVVVEGTELKSIELVEHSETAGIGDTGAEKYIASIIDAQSMEVDAESGATITSDAIKKAVNAALDSDSVGGEEAGDDEEAAESADGFEDGEHTGKAKGFGGEVEVTVVVKDGKITEVEIGDHSESPGMADPAFDKVPAAIVAANSPDVDAASSATVTSDAIMNAVKDALGL